MRPAPAVLEAFAAVVVSVLVTAGHAGASAAAVEQPAKAQAGPKPGTVTGTLVLDGKPIAVKTAIAAAFPRPFDPSVKTYKIALSTEPLAVDAQPADTLPERLGMAVATGLTITLDDSPRCTFILRIHEPDLPPAGAIVKKGSACPAFTFIGSNRVEGTVMSTPDGKDEVISGHKVSFTLHFNAPILN